MNSKLPKALQPVAANPRFAELSNTWGTVSDVHIVASPKFKHRLEKAIERENFPQNVHYIVQETQPAFSMLSTWVRSKLVTFRLG